MVIAADYPFLDILWTMIIFFAWVVWIWMMVVILTDVFSRHDIGGWSKALWCVFMILLPFIGVLTYLIFQHDGMAKRQAERAAASKQQFDSYVQEVAARQGTGAAGEIEKAQALLEKGAINQGEFDALKAKALAAAS